MVEGKLNGSGEAIRVKASLRRRDSLPLSAARVVCGHPRPAAAAVLRGERRQRGPGGASAFCRAPRARAAAYAPRTRAATAAAPQGLCSFAEEGHAVVGAGTVRGEQKGGSEFPWLTVVGGVGGPGAGTLTLPDGDLRWVLFPNTEFQYCIARQRWQIRSMMSRFSARSSLPRFLSPSRWRPWNSVL
eukprot:COSAG02_NODE_284_length_25691_cov_14.733354_24_plen_187_part_00